MKSTITVKGMHCSSCETLLNEALTEIPGVKEAKIDSKKGTAIVTHDANVPINKLRAAIEAEGYKTA